MSVLLALGDIHSPYVDKRALDQAVAVTARLKPDVIVQVGDAYEFDNGSAWRACAERERPREEFARGRDRLGSFWRRIQDAAPGAKCHMLWGNHDERLVKRAWEKVPEAAEFVHAAVRKMMTFPGVKLHDEEIVYLGRFGGERWSAVHGHGAIGSHAAQYATNIVCGHLHRGYVVTVPGLHFELNAGWLGDGSHHSKFYARARASNWNHGVAVVDDFGPRFIRLEEKP